MASIKRLDTTSRKGFRIRFYVDQIQREIYLKGLSRATERVASNVARYCDDLAQARANNVAASAETIAWVSSTDGSIRDKLVEWGLADPVTPKLSLNEGRQLDAFLTAYIDGRADAKPSTRTNYKQTQRLLVEHFGGNKVLRTITQADADRWVRFMVAKKLADATISKHGKRAKTMFQHAVRDRLLTSNPFSDIKGGSESNPDRQHFVDIKTAKKVMAACPDADWRLIFALTRFGGLRCPCEVVGLKWSHVDWENNRLLIDASKTARRFCPISPEIMEALQESRSVARPGAIYCVEKYRDRRANLRTQFNRILERAGVPIWPKLFVNLRSTRRTELQDKFPDHVVNKWLGHSSKVAEKHYLQVTESHLQQAREFRSLATTAHEVAGVGTETTKPSNLLGLESVRKLVLPYVMTPTGVEPVLPP